MKLLFLLLLIPSLTFGAITERYVSSAGSGSADGTSAANSMSYATFKDYMETGGSFTAAAGDRFNIVAGAYSLSATDTFVNGGTSTSPVVIRGYSSSIGDGYLGRTNGNGALITTNMPAITYSSTNRLTIGTANFVILECINVAASVSNSAIGVGPNCVLKSCKVVNSSTNAAAVGVNITTSSHATLFDCDIELTGASGGAEAVQIGTGFNGQRVLCNRIKGGPAIGILSAGCAAIVGNVIFAQAGIGISSSSTGSASLIYGNTIVGGTGDAIDIVTGTTVLSCIVNNIITDNTNNGIDMVSAANAGFIAYNRTRDNGTAINSGTDWVAATSYAEVTTDTGGAETDYVNSGSNDYRIIQASPARGTGILKYSTIGALQPQSSETSSTFGR